MAGLVMQVSGSLAEVDILPDVSIFHTSMVLGRRMVKEVGLKLTLRRAERQYTESPPDEEL